MSVDYELILGLATQPDACVRARQVASELAMSEEWLLEKPRRKRGRSNLIEAVSTTSISKGI